ncbi:MAG: hypothetical protein RH862_03610 [Leptospiraceae bacterium]
MITFSGTGSHGSIDGTGTDASFYLPRGLVSDGERLFVADTYNHMIRQIDLGSGDVSTLAGDGSSGNSDGTGTGASFYYPFSLTTDGNYLYIADKNNHLIRRVNFKTREVITFAGTGSSGSADGIGTGASLASPLAITTDGAFLYVTEGGYHLIRKINLTTREVVTLAGTGSSGFDDGTGTGASFHGSCGIATDGDYLYVADTENNTIRMVDKTTGEVTTIAGTGSSGNNNGFGISASFSQPRGIVSDGSYLYISDTSNKLVRKIDLTTMEVTTLAGSGSSGSSDGNGINASFAFPRDITTDGNALYLADRDYSLIRKIE